MNQSEKDDLYWKLSEDEDLTDKEKRDIYYSEIQKQENEEEWQRSQH